jgi:exodeoxyribonuclease V alpha subunit
VNDRTHGQQFKSRFLKTSAPTSVEGIEKYLASGIIRGIGPVYAKKLLRAFEKVFDAIEAEPQRLQGSRGYRSGPRWSDHSRLAERSIMARYSGASTALGKTAAELPVYARHCSSHPD